MARVKSELSDAKNTVEELALKVAKARVQERERKREFDTQKKYVATEGSGQQLTFPIENDLQYMKIVRELESVKQEVDKLKLDRAYVVKEKKMVEEETKKVQLRMESKLKLVEDLENEIEVVDEEHMLVELARIEANRECGELEKQRKVELEFYSLKLMEAKSRVRNLLEDIERAEDLEAKLAITNSDLDVLQNEMVFLRAMEKNGPSSEIDISKEELASLKEEYFQLVSWIDVAKEEILLISTEVTCLRKLEEVTERKVKDLNSKLLRWKMKLEASSVADQKSKLILSNLVLTVESLQSSISKTVDEKDRMIMGTKHLKFETKMNDSDINNVKQRLAEAVVELGTVKASEKHAFERLRILSKRAKKLRKVYRDPHIHPPRSTITIARREYNYLRDKAQDIKKLAEKKIKAAEAWVETLKDSEDQVFIQTEAVKKEIRKFKEKQTEDSGGGIV